MKHIVFELAPHFLESGGGEECYLDFYYKLIQHQRTNLLVSGCKVLGTLLKTDEVSSIKTYNFSLFLPSQEKEDRENGIFIGCI